MGTVPFPSNIDLSPRAQDSLLLHRRLNLRREQQRYIRTMLARPTPHIMLTGHEALLFGSLLLCLFLLHHIRRVKQDWQAFGNLPAYSVLVSPIDILSRVLPHIPQVSDGRDWGWKNVYERQYIPRVRYSLPAQSPCLGVFAASKSDIVQIRSIIPDSTPQLILADATAAKVRPLSGGTCAQFAYVGYLSRPYGIFSGHSNVKSRPGCYIRAEYWND